MKRLKELPADTRGQDLIEYALMAGFVAVAAFAIMPGLADAFVQMFARINNHLGGGWVRVVSAVCAVVILGAIVFRRKEGSE